MIRIGPEGAARICAAGLAADFATYLVLTAVPLKAIELGAGTVTLGLLPALSSTIYILSAFLFGRISDAGGRLRLARIGALFLGAGAVLLAYARTIPALFAFLPFVAVGGGLFWPTVQGELGARSTPADLGRAAGCFNVAWSAGKMLGYLAAGQIAERFGSSAPLLLAPAVELAVFLLVPGGAPRRLAPDGAQPVRVDASPIPAARFRRAAWAANLVAFGVGATLNYQFPKRILSLGYQAGDFGNFLALVGLSQTATFAVLGLRGGWERRPVSFIVPATAGIASAGALLLAASKPAIYATAPGIGVALGFAYSLSLFHSLHTPAGHGRNAGIHEALLGSGALIMPLAGGIAARSGGLGAPYFVCASAMGIVVLLSLLWLRPAAPAGRADGPSRRASRSPWSSSTTRPSGR